MRKGLTFSLFFLVILSLTLVSGDERNVYSGSVGSCTSNFCSIHVDETLSAPAESENVGTLPPYFYLNRGRSDDGTLDGTYVLYVNGVYHKITNYDFDVGIFSISVKKIYGDNSLVEFSFIKNQNSNARIAEEGAYTVKAGNFIDINNVTVTVREISWALSGDTEPVVDLNGNNAQVCHLHTGESCKIFFGAATQPTSKNLKITVESIATNENSPSESTAMISIKKIKETIVPDEDPIEMPEDTVEETYFCQGCEFEGVCYPFGYRNDEKFCNAIFDYITYNLENQEVKGMQCDNNFECDSNVCFSGECVSPSLLQKILDFIKSIFG